MKKKIGQTEAIMKTLNELYTEVIASDALKAEFLALKNPEEIVAFAKKNGCDATLDDIKTFFEEKKNSAGELSEEELEQVAGGKSASIDEAEGSVITIGIGCIYKVIQSALKGKAGTAIEGQGMLCALDGNKDGDWVKGKN